MEKSEHQLRVEEFMRKAGQEIPDRPMIPACWTTLQLRASLIIEEALETVEALGFLVSVEIEETPDGDKRHDVTLYKHRQPDLEKIVDGCCDLKVVTTGTLSACGVNDEEPQRLVDEANLAKFKVPDCPECHFPMDYHAEGEAGWYCHGHEDGKERYLPPEAGGYKREDGKWIKPGDWKAPDLKGELQRQTKLASPESHGAD